MIFFPLWHSYVLFSTLYVGGLAQNKDEYPAVRAPRLNGLHLATQRASRVKPALITTPPQINHQALIARAALATCGYISGNAGRRPLFDRKPDYQADHLPLHQPRH